MINVNTIPFLPCVLGLFPFPQLKGANDMLIILVTQTHSSDSLFRMLPRRAYRSFVASTQALPCASTARKLATSWVSSKKFNYPLTPDDVPRNAGLPTMFRLPSQSTAEGLDACFLGVPLDTGTYAHRTGAR